MWVYVRVQQYEQKRKRKHHRRLLSENKHLPCLLLLHQVWGLGASGKLKPTTLPRINGEISLKQLWRLQGRQMGDVQEIFMYSIMATFKLVHLPFILFFLFIFPFNKTSLVVEKGHYILIRFILWLPVGRTSFWY